MQGGGEALLHGEKVHIHSQELPKRGAPSNTASLKRVAAALGAKVNVRICWGRVLMIRSRAAMLRHRKWCLPCVRSSPVPVLALGKPNADCC